MIGFLRLYDSDWYVPETHSALFYGNNNKALKNILTKVLTCGYILFLQQLFTSRSFQLYRVSNIIVSEYLSRLSVWYNIIKTTTRTTFIYWFIWLVTKIKCHALTLINSLCISTNRLWRPICIDFNLEPAPMYFHLIM